MSVTLPDLKHKNATIYSKWTNDNRAKVLQLDATVAAYNVELDKIILLNDYCHNQLQMRLEPYEEQLGELIELIADVRLKEERLSGSKQAIYEKYKIETLSGLLGNHQTGKRKANASKKTSS